VGALPTAITNNLNFGNPLKPHIYYQLREAVLGMAAACEAFETPVTGGNVSLYNETDGRAIYPTPVIGMVGVIDDVSTIVRHAFADVGHDIVLLGDNTEELGGSEYVYVTADLVAGAPPKVDLEVERALQHAVLAMTRARLLRSAHDCSEGGLACALAESALGDGEAPLGVRVQIDDDLRPVGVLFGEAQGRIVVSCDPERTGEVLQIAARYEVPARRIGAVTSAEEGFSITVRGASVHATAAAMADAYFDSLSRVMDAPATEE
jgi:phosphoribosylformylglycinamidine synthase